MAKNRASITFTVDEDMKAYWTEKANKRELSLSAFIRRAVNAYCIMLEKKEQIRKDK